MSRAAAAARSVALRDQLVAALRNGDLPMSTPELAALSGLPWHEVGWWGDCTLVHDLVERRDYKLLVCTGQQRHSVLMPPCPGSVYPHLRRLEALGIVARVDFADLAIPTRLQLIAQESQRGNTRPVYWRYTDDQSDVAFNAVLDAMERAG